MRTTKNLGFGLGLAAIFCPILAGVLLSSIALTQEPAKSIPSRPTKPLLVPFFNLDKAAGFKVYKAPKAQFIEMMALVAKLPAETVPGQKQPANATYLQYGYKKGGVGVVYQMKKQPRLSPEATFKALLKKRIFSDRQYFKEWSIIGIPDGTFLLAVSGTTPEVRDELRKAIGK